jgi:hypothetical protein
MKRRDFIHCAIGLACLRPGFNESGREKRAISLLTAAAWDLAGKESEHGYGQALGRLLRTQPPFGRTIIAPSASSLHGNVLPALAREAQLGATVLIDLADGFASRSEVTRTRMNLRHRLDIRIADPVASATGDYVFYRWPLPALVRHFTRTSYIEPGQNMSIAHLGAQSTAVRKELGLGSVVVIGSPLGSPLLAGYEQAHQILARMLTTAAAG